MRAGHFEAQRLGHSVAGHIGERINRRVALVTDDFRLYHELTRVFGEHGFRLLGLAPGDVVPGTVVALIGGPEDDPRSVDVHPDPEVCLLRALWKLDGRRDGPYRRLVVGIDPGATIGLALLGDGIVMVVAEAHDVEEAAARVTKWLAAVPHDAEVVHVGDGARDVALPIIAALRRGIPRLNVVTVPEQGTTPYHVHTTSRHTDAAILIALREPLA